MVRRVDGNGGQKRYERERLEPEVFGKRQPVPSLACRGFVGHQYSETFRSCHGVTEPSFWPCGADLRFISISPISARALSGKSPKLTIPRGPLAVPSWAPAPHQGERREGRGVAPSAPPAAPPSFGARRPIRPDTKGGYGNYGEDNQGHVPPLVHRHGRRGRHGRRSRRARRLRAGRRRQHRQDRRRRPHRERGQLRAQRCAHPQRHRHQLDDAARRGDRFRPGMGLRRGGLRPRLRPASPPAASWPSRARRSSSSRSSPRTPTRPWATSSPR